MVLSVVSQANAGGRMMRSARCCLSYLLVLGHDTRLQRVGATECQLTGPILLMLVHLIPQLQRHVAGGVLLLDGAAKRGNALSWIRPFNH